MITNKHSVALSLAVMLVNDNYDHDSRDNSISATGLLKPLRMLALTAANKGKLVKDIDVTDLVASVTGSAVHDALENVWLNPVKLRMALTKLGYSNISLLVNPSPQELKNSPNSAVVYVENRREKKLTVLGKEFILTGKYDLVMQGKLEDLKNTGSFKVTKTLKEQERFENLIAQVTSVQDMFELADKCPSMFEYAMQGSLYRWLNKDIIKENFMSIQFIIKDFAKFKIGQEFYPNVNPFQLDITLFSADMTELWIETKLTNLLEILETNQLPHCSDTELWRNPPVFKVYKDTKSKRALPKGTFDTEHEARDFNLKRKVLGDVRLIPSVPKRCTYCSAREVCTQYDKFIEIGLLKPI